MIHQQYPNLGFLNQDPLNILFANNFKKLSGRFNHLVASAMAYEQIDEVSREIYHFNGLTLNMDMNDLLSQLYIKYLVRTKFFDHKSLEHVCRRFSYFVDRWRKIAHVSAKRKRVFFLQPEILNQKPLLDLVTNTLDIDAKDIVINVKSPNVSQILRDEISKPDRVIFFALNEKSYDSIRQQLESLGFKEDQDFFGVTDLILQDPLNSCQNRIIRDM